MQFPMNGSFPSQQQQQQQTNKQGTSTLTSNSSSSVPTMNPMLMGFPQQQQQPPLLSPQGTIQLMHPSLSLAALQGSSNGHLNGANGVNSLLKMQLLSQLNQQRQQEQNAMMQQLGAAAAGMPFPLLHMPSTAAMPFLTNPIAGRMYPQLSQVRNPMLDGTHLGLMQFQQPMSSLATSVGTLPPSEPIRGLDGVTDQMSKSKAIAIDGKETREDGLKHSNRNLEEAIRNTTTVRPKMSRELSSASAASTSMKRHKSSDSLEDSESGGEDGLQVNPAVFSVISPKSGASLGGSGGLLEQLKDAAKGAKLFQGMGGQERLQIEFISLGSLPTNCPIQTYGRQRLPIPDGLAGTHRMYSQAWRFDVSYTSIRPPLISSKDGLLDMPEASKEAVCLRWKVTNLFSGRETEMIESLQQAMIRQESGRTLTNVLMQRAMEDRARDLERQLEQEVRQRESQRLSDPDRDELLIKENNMRNVIRRLRPKRCGEGLLFFGLRHDQVQMMHYRTYLTIQGHQIEDGVKTN